MKLVLVDRNTETLSQAQAILLRKAQANGRQPAWKMERPSCRSKNGFQQGQSPNAERRHWARDDVEHFHQVHKTPYCGIPIQLTNIIS